MGKYVIWSPGSNRPPTVTFEPDASAEPPLQRAIKVAGRMASQFPGQTFHVCKLVKTAKSETKVTFEDVE